MSKKSILITGAAGFIGSNLSIKLSARNENEDLYLLDRDAVKLKVLEEDMLSLGERSSYFLHNDISDASVLHQIEEGKYDVVVHLAAVPRVAYSVEQPSETFWENTQKAVQIFEACLKGESRVVFASSSSVYGDGVQLPTVENSILTPKSPYALQKMAAEKAATMLSVLRGLDAVSLRFFNVYGPRQYADNAYATVISAWMSACSQGSKLRLDGDGSQSRDFCYVDDVCRAISLCIYREDKWNGEAFNVAQGNSHDLKWLLEWFVKEFDLDMSKDALMAPSRLGDVHKTLADMSYTKRVLGFEPSWPLERGLRETVSWWRKKPSQKDIQH